jgi:hypothetical protein
MMRGGQGEEFQIGILLMMELLIALDVSRSCPMNAVMHDTAHNPYMTPNLEVNQVVRSSACGLSGVA